MVTLVVLGNVRDGVTGDLLSLPAGPLVQVQVQVQVQRQRPDLVEAWYFLLAPSLVVACSVPRVLECPGQESLFDRRPVVLGVGLLLLQPLRLPVDQVPESGLRHQQLLRTRAQPADIQQTYYVLRAPHAEVRVHGDYRVRAATAADHHW